MEEKGKLRRREPITDTQLLMTITICIFVGMYILAILIWGGGFKKPQMLFDMLNDNAYLIIISCGLTIVMITGSIDISVGGVTALVAMVGVMILNGNLTLFNGLIAALGLGEGARIVFALLMSLLIGLAFGLVQGYLIAHLEIQPFIITLAGMFFARGMITIISVDPQKGPQNLMDILQKRIEMAWLGSPNKKGVMIPARMEIGVVIALVIVVLVYAGRERAPVPLHGAPAVRASERHRGLCVHDAHRRRQRDERHRGGDERHCLLHHRRHAPDRRRRQCDRHLLRNDDPGYDPEDHWHEQAE